MTENYDRDDLAERVAKALTERFRGNKRSAYIAAKVSPQTLDRALNAERIREDKRLAIEDMLAEVGYVSAPGETAHESVSEADVMAAIRRARQMMDAFERQQGRRRP